jgi:hypothetical protein
MVEVRGGFSNEKLLPVWSNTALNCSRPFTKTIVRFK